MQVIDLHTFYHFRCVNPKRSIGVDGYQEESRVGLSSQLVRISRKEAITDETHIYVVLQVSIPKIMYD